MGCAMRSIPKSQSSGSMNTPSICPHLPQPDAHMTHRCLTELKGADREVFYHTALKYGHTLWLQGHAGRSILAITRALYADVPEGAVILKDWALPYAALYWIASNHQSDDFPGNPRISFQHQATRLRGERQALRRARAWAVWSLICKARPSLPGDPTQGIEEPDLHTIKAELGCIGHSNEVALWQAALAES
ncbi:Unannotated [Lentimonas sp. CC11]|nr:Unannotated [Lentimonas sp. CC11]